MSFICKLLGCGGDKDSVAENIAKPQAFRNERRAFVSDDVVVEKKKSPLPRVVEKKSPARESCRSQSSRMEEKVERSDPTSSEDDDEPALLQAPPATLPRSWQRAAKETKDDDYDDKRNPEDDDDDSRTCDDDDKKDIEIVIGAPSPRRLSEDHDDDGLTASQLADYDHDDDDDDSKERGTSFGQAWRTFKLQEEAGFGPLRDYVSKNYVMLLRKMLAPTREKYDLSALGPETFDFRGRELRRDDFVATNERGFALQCSLWRDRRDDEDDDASYLSSRKKHNRRRKYCVVYAHDVGGSRLGSLSSMGVALDAGAHGFCAFDSTACGHSEGSLVTFGHFERYDLACVVANLVSQKGFTDVVLWGRGAGAVACVKYAVGLEDPGPVHSYFETQSNALYDSVFGGKVLPEHDQATTKDNKPQQQQPKTEERTSSSSSSSSLNTHKRPQAATSRHSSLWGGAPASSSAKKWTYAEKRTVTVDVFGGPLRQREQKATPDRVRLASQFAASLELVVETSLWVVSKPPLVISKVSGVAEEMGLLEGDVLCGVGTSMKLPHSAEDFRTQLLALAKSRHRQSELRVHFLREAPLNQVQRECLEPYVKPAGLVLDCVIDSPSALVASLRDSAAQREPVLASLLDPLLGSALDVLYHSVKKRANFDPNLMSLKTVAPHVHGVPALFGANDFSDVDRGVPRLADLSSVVFDAYGSAEITNNNDSAATNKSNNFLATFGSGRSSTSSSSTTEKAPKTLVKYNAPLRLALRGSLDAMSSKFLNKTFVFLQTLPGLKDHADRARANWPSDDDSPPRWVVTTRPWAQKETVQLIDDYE